MADTNASTKTPTYSLIVRQPFGDYQRGDKIVDAKEVDAVLAGENAKDVMRVTN